MDGGTSANLGLKIGVMVECVVVDGQNRFGVVDVQSAAHYVTIRKVTQTLKVCQIPLSGSSLVGEVCMRQARIQFNRSLVIRESVLADVKLII